MEEHFVNYNQALALKELGFDEPCFGAYRSHSHFIGHLDIQYCTTNNLKQYEWLLHTLAPLKSQVFKWFRDEYNIQGYIYPLTVQGYKNGRIFTNYIYTIKDLYNDIIESNPVNEEFENYEEAESACIDRLISILKEKKL